MVVAANNMGDTHIMVVDNHSQHIGRRSISAQEDEVVNLAGSDLYLSLNTVLDNNMSLIGRTQADCIGRILGRWLSAVAPGGAERRQELLCLAQQGLLLTLAHTVLLCGGPGSFAFLTAGLKFFGGGIAAEGLAARHHLFGAFNMAGRLLALEDRRFVGIKAEPAHAIENRIDGFLGGTRLVGILDPQQEFSLVAAGIQVVEKGCASATNVEHASRGGGKSRNRRHKSDKASGSASDLWSGRHEHPDGGSGKSRADFIMSEGGAGGVLHLVLNGPLYFALGLCLGAMVYFASPVEPGWGGGVAAGACILGGGILALQRTGSFVIRLAAMLLVGAVCGATISKLHTQIRAAPPVQSVIGPAMVEGWVTAIEPGTKGVRLRIDVHAISGVASTDMPAHIRLTHSLSLNVAPGRFVRCWSVLRPPPQPSMPGDYAFNRQAFFEGLDAVGYVQGRCRGGPLGTRAGLWDHAKTLLAVTRRALAVHVKDAAGERAGGFAAALASGDRSFMSQEDMEALRRSGLAHLLAISGLHLGIVGGLVYVSTRRLLALWEWLALRIPVQKPAAAIALIMSGAYLLLSGASISTQRAFIMAAVFFGAILLDRSPLSFRSFAVAMIAVILIQPHSVMTPGFQMSFAATGALIATYLVWREHDETRQAGKRNRYVFSLQSLVVTSIIGAAATAPFALYHFDRVAPGGIWANLMAMPIITFISAPMAGLAMATAPIGLDEPFLRLFGWSLEQVLNIAHWVSARPGSGLTISDPMPALVLVVMSVGLVAVCLVTGLRRRVSALAITTSLAALAWFSAPRTILHWSPSGEVLIRTNAQGWQKLDVADGDGLSPLTLADLSASDVCKGKDCIFETAIGRVAISDMDGEAGCPGRASVILYTGVTAPPCAQGAGLISWSDNVAAGGISLVKPFIGPYRRSTPKCGQRKWQPCLQE